MTGEERRGEERRGGRRPFIQLFILFCHCLYEEVEGMHARNNTLKLDTIIEVIKYHVHSSFYSSKLYRSSL
jgi:hypothetical protein